MAVNIAGSLGATATSAIKNGGKSLWGGVKSGNITTLGTIEGVSQVAHETSQGKSLGAALAKGAATSAAYYVAPKLMVAKDVSQLALSGARAAVNFRDRRGQEISLGQTYGRVGGNFVDTNQAQTMRQAAVQQIQHNKLNARSALGGEARIFSGQKYNQHTRPYI